ncbi:MAG: site-specific recombinase [Betaproteobacteria bacterium]|jgi:site-specific recombinase
MPGNGHPESLEAVFSRVQPSGAGAAALFTALFDTVRPRPVTDSDEAALRYRRLLDFLASHPEHCATLREAFLKLCSEVELRSFFSDSGLLPATGFFSELWRKISDRLLPGAPDNASLRGLVSVIFHNRNDHRWLSELPGELALEFWQRLDLQQAHGAPAMRRLLESILEACRVLSARIAAMGIDAEIGHALPQDHEAESPFLAQGEELARFIQAYRASLADPQHPVTDERHLLVLLDQCRDTLRRVQAAALTRGTSLRLSYLLVRLNQHIERLETLLQLLAARFSDTPARQAVASWAGLVRNALCSENRRGSLRLHCSQLLGRLALRVTKNAGRTGEHYITTDRAGYFGMWGSAMGAGLLIGVMALIKIMTVRLHLPPLIEGIAFSLNYAIGFMLVHILHFTIATKQPAMTAAAIADTIGQSNGRLREVERLGTLVIDVMRSQFAAICGNVLMAFPVALAVGLLLTHTLGSPVPADKAQHLLHDLDPLASLALLHAAIAGVWLFLAGLISGYFDNKAAYERIGDRVAHLRWLQALAGPARAAALGRYIDQNLGGLAGNFFFGFMLGMTGTIGAGLGLPLDIRHIAFASANLAYGAVGLEMNLSLAGWVWGVIGVALIGLVNLTVSFALALWVALRAHGVRFRHADALLQLVLQRFLSAPLQFFWPPAAGSNTGRSTPKGT